MSEKADWIAVDWGTSNLRIWVIGAGGDVLAALTGPEGMGQLSAADYEPVLLRHVETWLADGRETDVLICGMAGARSGWQEAPYRSVPCSPAGEETLRVQTRDPRLGVRILPGLSQAAPADVMRGEETQIAGFLAANPRFDGTICLPGTHSKWVQVSAGEVVSFRTFMTGEMFALLSTQSVLRLSVDSPDQPSEPFLQAVGDALSAPQNTASALFSIRAEGLLSGLPPAAARARLSGLLIGLELAGARPWWLGTRIALIGAGRLTGLYRDALAAQGQETETQSGETLVLAGLTASRAARTGRTS